jgi:hypothetical protein
MLNTWAIIRKSYPRVPNAESEVNEAWKNIRRIEKKTPNNGGKIILNAPS